MVASPLPIANPKRRRAFTLIELMVVILILAILAALIVPRIVGNTGKAKTAAATTDLRTLGASLRNFRLDCDRYPTTEEGLGALRVAPSGLEGKWRGPYISKDVPTDPWQNQYVYESPGSSGTDSFIVRSYGADGQPGGDGENADIEEGD